MPNWPGAEPHSPNESSSFSVLPLEHHHLGLASIADVQEPLLGVGRERRARGRRAVAALGRLAFAADEHLRHVRAIEREHLHALAAAIGDVHEAVLRHARGVNRLHELRRAPLSASGSAGLGGSSVGLLPNAPHIRLNLPVSASKTMIRRLPYPSATKSSFVAACTNVSAG